MNHLILTLILFSLINSKLIPTNDLNAALSEAEPGDIIELKSGIYRDVPYNLKSGLQGKPIKIKSATNADVVFSGTQTSCIFDGEGASYINIEGRIVFKNALCGIKALNSNNINITGIIITDMREHGILISGDNHYINNNTIFSCSLHTKAIPEEERYGGWQPCIGVFDFYNSYPPYFSNNITLENNIIGESYGEGIRINYCNSCYIIKNQITNTLNMSIFLYSTNNTIVDKNLIRISSNSYNSWFGRTTGIGMTTSYNKIFGNITITNNIIIGANMGVLFYPGGSKGGYDKIKIFHNTLWNISQTPIRFDESINTPTGCEMKNNFIYVNETKQFASKSSWSFGYNLYYNTYDVPDIYYDTTSKASKQLNISTIFNSIKGCNNYLYDLNIDANCFRPSKNPGKLKLYHSGTPLTNSVYWDYSNCYREYSKNPSIGAFEFPQGCSEDVDPEPTPDTFDVKFKINACTSAPFAVKMVGSLCNWNVGSCPTMTKEGNCTWTYTFKEGTSNSFNNKFVVAQGSIALMWESDPNRRFSGSTLASLAKKIDSGIYEFCNYARSEKLITLTCKWR